VNNCAKARRGSGPWGAARMEACSACAGDYEDPDATAPPVEGEEAADAPDAEEFSGEGAQVRQDIEHGGERR
jgi:hypothetical protein